MTHSDLYFPCLELMSTRSAICYQLPSGRIRGVFCHWCGHPDHQLPILNEHYNAYRKVVALVKPGWMSHLRTEDTWESQYGTTDEQKAQTREPQPLYKSERGPGPWCDENGDYSFPPRTLPADQVRDYWRGAGCEHLYIFKEGHWTHEDLYENY